MCNFDKTLSFYITYSDKGDWVAEVILQGDESTSHYRERLTEQLMKGRTDFASEILKKQNSFPRKPKLVPLARKHLKTLLI